MCSTIVLAGDPKQLGPVVKSHLAKELGYDQSYMERLMTYPLYSRDPVSGLFNNRYITQLVKNYRSHESILRIPNKLFYENKLEACAESRDTDWYIDSRLLPSAKFPIIFHSVLGRAVRSEKDLRYICTT